MEYAHASGVYGIFNTINGKCYVGSTKGFRGRWYNHRSNLRRGVHDNSYLQRSWDKYGEGAFEFRVLQLCSVEQLSMWEEHHIRHMMSDERAKGYNLDPVVAGCRIVSDATRAKISASNKGKIRTLETRARIREARLGTKASPEARVNMSKGQTGRTHTEETKAKFREKKHTDETKAKIAKSHLGINASQETRAKIREARSHQVFSAESRAKMGDAVRGRPVSAETREKRRVSMQNIWARRKSTNESALNQPDPEFVVPCPNHLPGLDNETH